MPGTTCPESHLTGVRSIIPTNNSGCQGCNRVVNAGPRQPTRFGSDRPPETAQNDDDEDRQRPWQSPISRDGCGPVPNRIRATPPGPPHIENRDSSSHRRGVGRNVVQLGEQKSTLTTPPHVSTSDALRVTVAAEAKSVVDPKEGLSQPTCWTRQKGTTQSYASPRSGPVGPTKGSNGAQTRNLSSHLHPEVNPQELCLARSMRGAVALAAPVSGAEEEEGATVKAKNEEA